jgi:putative FmdB family regulatory protein
MPIYVYECQKCNEEVEEIQKMTDPAPEKCEKCGAAGEMKKKIGVSNFTLGEGGVGWAKDGYSG